MRRREKILVLYKNGTEIVVKCDDFNVKKYVGGAWEVSWSNAKPNPLRFGVDDVAAVYHLNPRN